MRFDNFKLIKHWFLRKKKFFFLNQFLLITKMIWIYMDFAFCYFNFSFFSNFRWLTEESENCLSNPMFCLWKLQLTISKNRATKPLLFLEVRFQEFYCALLKRHLLVQEKVHLNTFSVVGCLRLMHHDGELKSFDLQFCIHK